MQPCFRQLSCGAQLREPLRKAPREIIPGLKEHLKGSWSTAATFLLFCSVIKFSKEGSGREGTGRCGVAEMLALAQAVKAFEATVPRQKTWGMEGCVRRRLLLIKMCLKSNPREDSESQTVKRFLNIDSIALLSKLREYFKYQCSDCTFTSGQQGLLTKKFLRWSAAVWGGKGILRRLCLWTQSLHPPSEGVIYILVLICTSKGNKGQDPILCFCL